MKMHDMCPMPPGASVGEVLPAFSDVRNELRLGTPNQECASCRKPFSVARKPRRVMRIYLVGSPLPIAWSYRLCGACIALYQQGGTAQEAVLAAVQAFHEGQEAGQ